MTTEPVSAFAQVTGSAVVFRHGDMCPECGGCLILSESEDYASLVLRCDECAHEPNVGDQPRAGSAAKPEKPNSK